MDGLIIPTSELVIRDNKPQVMTTAKKSPMDDLQSGLSGLTNFSNVLSNTFGTVDKSILELKDALSSAMQLIHTLENQLHEHNSRLKDLEFESSDQRGKVEGALKNVTSMEKSVKNQLTDATLTMQKEILHQRTNTKIDLMALKGNVSNTMSEALSLFTNPRKSASAPMRELNPNSTATENMEVLMDRIKNLEEAQDIQQKVNNELNKAMNDDSFIKNIYDTLTGHIEKLDEELYKSKLENNALRNKLLEMAEQQGTHQKYIQDLRTVSKDKLRKLNRSRSFDDEVMKSDRIGSAHSNRGNKMRRSNDNANSEPSSHKMRRSHDNANYEQDLLDDHEHDREHEHDRDHDREHEHDRDHDHDGRRRRKVKRRSMRKSQDKGIEVQPTEAAVTETYFGNADHISSIPNSPIANSYHIPPKSDLSIEAKIATEANRRRKEHKNRMSRKSLENKEQLSNNSNLGGNGSDIGDDSINDSGINSYRSDIPNDHNNNNNNNNLGKENDALGKNDVLSSRSQKRSNDNYDLKMSSDTQIIMKKSRNNDSNDDVIGIAASKKYNNSARASNDHHHHNDEEIENDHNNDRGNNYHKNNHENNPHKNDNLEDVDYDNHSYDSRGSDNNNNNNNNNKRKSPKNRKNKKHENESEEDSIISYDYEDGDDEDDDDDSYYSGNNNYNQRILENKRKIDELYELMKKQSANINKTELQNKTLNLQLADYKSNHDSLRTKVETLILQEDLDRKMSDSMFAKIAQAKVAWSKVLSELLYSLDNIQDSTQDDDMVEDGKSWDEYIGLDRPIKSKDPLDNQHFYKRTVAFATLIEENISHFSNKENLDDTLKKLFPALDQIQKASHIIMQMDKNARTAPMVQFCLDDFTCSDLTNNMRLLFENAMKSSIPVLEAAVSKSRLKDELEKLIHNFSQTVNLQTMKELEKELKQLMNNKVDHEEFVKVTSRHASWTEFQKLKEDVLRASGGMDNLNNYHNNINGNGNNGNNGNNTNNIIDPEKEAERIQAINELKSRFDLLRKQFVELESQSYKYVPRDEIHEAMKAIVGEMKMIKKNYVASNVFKDGLKTKADIDEVEKLMKALNSAVSELNLTTNTTEYAATAAAMHSRCLTCDKPILGTRARSSKNSSKSVAIPMANSLSTPSLYNKNDDGFGRPSSEKQSLFNKLASPDINVSAKERARIVTELAIIRSSIDTLPDIT
eukprot:gene11228-15068_t